MEKRSYKLQGRMDAFEELEKSKSISHMKAGQSVLRITWREEEEDQLSGNMESYSLRNELPPQHIEATEKIHQSSRMANGELYDCMEP